MQGIWYTNVIFDHKNIVIEKIVHNKTKEINTRRLILDYQFGKIIK